MRFWLTATASGVVGFTTGLITKNAALASIGTLVIMISTPQAVASWREWVKEVERRAMEEAERVYRQKRAGEIRAQAPTCITGADIYAWPVTHDVEDH